ncbi:hypothetical protein HMI54_008918 [Coelomomyces lativittatus]|nr:hypothetical protein HMI54_008918 [Coelomomyces lativittatus]KAJ1508033.1 hypothetical protein HMI55_000539 [Coelomomyces lativittatus]KAJ1511067.1 hypothetical protein HMI56_005853 [Coelomomyces lativittatus]
MSLLETMGLKQAPSRQLYDDDEPIGVDGISMDFTKQPHFQPTNLFHWQWHTSLSSSTMSPHLWTGKTLIVGEAVVATIMQTFLQTYEVVPMATCTFTYEKALGSSQLSISFYFLEDHVWCYLPFSSPGLPMELYTPFYLTFSYHLSPQRVWAFTSSSSAVPRFSYLSNVSVPFLTTEPLLFNEFKEPKLLSDFATTVLVHHPHPPYSTSLPCTVFILQLSRTLGQPDLDPKFNASWTALFKNLGFSLALLHQWMKALDVVRHRFDISNPIYV